MSSVATKTIQSAHKVDPKKVIWDALEGHLDKVEVTSGDVLVCVYVRPTTIKIKGPSGEDVEFDVGSTSRAKEDQFQGVVGLVVKIGPAFHEKHYRTLGLEPRLKVGDWVAFRVGDTIPFILDARAMRIIQGDFIRMRLADPDCIL